MIREALICQDADGLPEIQIDADHDGTYEKPVAAGYRQKTINGTIAGSAALVRCFFLKNMR